MLIDPQQIDVIVLLYLLNVEVDEMAEELLKVVRDETVKVAVKKAGDALDKLLSDSSKKDAKTPKTSSSD
jgi:transposase-like protein